MRLFSRNDNSLLTPEFAVLMGVAFLAFCNLSLFYGLSAYLESQHVPPLWRGVLLALEPCTALIVRPVASLYLTKYNSLRVVGIALLVLMVALCSYSLANGVWSLALVRILHGLGFVLLISSLVTLLVEIIPAQRCGQAFGVFAITSLLPYAVLPPIVERLVPLVGSEPHVYAMFSPLLALSLLALPYLGKRGRSEAIKNVASCNRPSLEEIRSNLRAPGVGSLLVANGLVFTATTVVFFFMKDRLLELNSSNVGLFFSISTAVTIGVRVFCSALLDKGNRAVMLAIVLTVLAGVLVLFSMAGSVDPLYGLAGLYGLCIGFAMPQLNAAMFVISPPHLRGLNTNMMLFTMDAGYVFGPLLAGGLLNAGVTTKGLFACFAVGPLLGAVLTGGLARLMRTHAPDTPRAED